MRSVVAIRAQRASCRTAERVLRLLARRALGLAVLRLVLSGRAGSASILAVVGLVVAWCRKGWKKGVGCACAFADIAVYFARTWLALRGRFRPGGRRECSLWTGETSGFTRATDAWIVPPRRCGAGATVCESGKPRQTPRRSTARIQWHSRQTPDVLLVLPSSVKCPRTAGPVHSRLVWRGAAPKRPAAHAWGTEAPSAHQKPSGQSWHPSWEWRLSDVE